MDMPTLRLRGTLMLTVAALAAFVASGCPGEKKNGQKAITKEAHTAFFPLTTGSHQPYDCEECHTGAQQTGTFTEFTCTSCHEHSQEVMDDRHMGAVFGYEFDSRNCYACHPKNEPVGINHEQRFPVRPGSSHAGLTCENCHLDTADRKIVDCIGCHTHAAEPTAVLHTAVPDYVYSNAQCVRCHPGSTVELLTVNHEERFPIAPGTKHAGFGCNTCHTTPGDRKQFECTNCHTHEFEKTKLTHALAVPNLPASSALCYSCHLRSQVDLRGNFNHELFFPIAAGSDHANLSCAFCHRVPGKNSEFTCATGCHPSREMFLKHAEVAGHEFVSPACLKCHADSQVDKVAEHLPFEVLSGSPHFLSVCLTCHPATRLDKPFAADFTKERTVCAPCHARPDMDAAHVGQPGYDFNNPPSCLVAGCHPDGRNP